MRPEREDVAAAIRNAAWWVRWYARPHQAPDRERAIRELAQLALSTGTLEAVTEALRAVML